MTDKIRKHIINLSSLAGIKGVGDDESAPGKKKPGAKKPHRHIVPDFDLPSPLGPGEGMDDAGLEEPEISWDKPTPDGDD